MLIFGVPTSAGTLEHDVQNVYVPPGNVTNVSGENVCMC